jgi:hypothetical protein
MNKNTSNNLLYSGSLNDTYLGCNRPYLNDRITDSSYQLVRSRGGYSLHRFPLLSKIVELKGTLYTTPEGTTGFKLSREVNNIRVLLNNRYYYTTLVSREDVKLTKKAKFLDIFLSPDNVASRLSKFAALEPNTKYSFCMVKR